MGKRPAFLNKDDEKKEGRMSAGQKRREEALEKKGVPPKRAMAMTKGKKR